MASTKILPHGESRTAGAGRAAALDSCTGSAATRATRKHLNKATKAEQLREFREYRWSARITARRVLRGTRVSFCGNPVSDIVGQGLYYDDKHLSRFSGLAACGNVCCCPVCNFKIMSYRQKQISQALRICKDRGYGVVFATLTLRHKKGEKLEIVRKKLLEIWRNVNKQRAFVKLLDDFGELGFIRAQEVTESNVNGWHPHLHSFFIFEHDLTVKQVNEFGARFADLWLKTVDRLNKKRSRVGLDSDYASPFVDAIGRPLAAHQVFKRVGLSDPSIEKYSRYCTVRKSVALPGEDIISRMSHELADSGTKIGKVKTHNDGTKALHLSYFDMIEILRQIGYTGVSKTDNPCYVRNSQNSKLLDRLARYGYSVPLLVALCKEYYKGMKGCRSLYWSRVRGRKISLREFLDVLDEKTDEELAQETYTDPKSHVLTIWDWKKCISRRPMLPAQLLTYCDLVKGDPELCRRWCIEHNICITPPNLRRRC